MTARTDPMNADQQAAIGRVVIAMRDGGMLWKEIVHQLGMSRAQLWRCAQLAEALRMKQKTQGMKHRDGCMATAAA